MRFIQSLMVGVLVLMALGESAAADEFMINGGSCIPANDIYSVYNNTSGTMTSGSGAIVECWFPVPELSSSPSHLYLLFKKSNADGGISVVYSRMSKATGQFSVPIAVVDADDESPSNDVKYLDVSFSDSYDPANYIYMVGVSFDHSSTVFYATSVY